MVLGGIGNIRGSVIAATDSATGFLPELLRSMQQVSYADLMRLVLIAVMLFSMEPGSKTVPRDVDSLKQPFQKEYRKGG